ncbi:hypothetical protein ABE26_05370 [Cytobacillus firmus]|nr:hypothetical protein [Cytobacillus firmus]
MGRDYKNYSDFDLERAFDQGTGHQNEDLIRELERRGYEDVDGELMTEYEYAEFQEEQERKKQKYRASTPYQSSIGSFFQGILGLMFLAFIIGLFIDRHATLDITIDIFLFVFRTIGKFVDALF